MAGTPLLSGNTSSVDAEGDLRLLEQPLQEGNSEESRVFPTTALIVSLWCWFVLSLGLALFETVVVPLATDQLGWSVSENGILLTASLTVGVVAMAVVSFTGASEGQWAVV